MPNECRNRIIITCEDCEHLNNLVQYELTREVGKSYNYYDKNITIHKQSVNGIKFTQITPNEPDYALLKKIVLKFPMVWIKNEWIEEGGKAGILLYNYEAGIQSHTWNDLSIDSRYRHFGE